MQKQALRLTTQVVGFRSNSTQATHVGGPKEIVRSVSENFVAGRDSNLNATAHFCQLSAFLVGSYMMTITRAHERECRIQNRHSL
jgi:hypothetical protein